MEERLEQALAFSNYRQTLNNQLQKLKLKTTGLLMYSRNGGTFTIDRELICFLDYLVGKDIKEATLLDDVGNPVLISDVPLFLSEVTTKYSEVTTDYYREFQSIRKSRNVKSILEIKDE